MKRFPGKAWWLAFLGVFFLLYFGKIAELSLRQAEYVYHPNTEAWEKTPRFLNLDFEEVYFEAGGGARLCGWWIPHPKSNTVVLFCKGNSGNISKILEEIRIYHAMGFGVFVFDYRGFGQSQGELSEQGTYQDAEAAWLYLQKKAPGHDVVIVGKSLGAAVAVDLAVKYPPKALILEGAFSGLLDIASERYPYFPVRWFLKFRYDVAGKIRQVRCPVLVIHSRDDEVVPFAHGVRVYGATPEPKDFLEISGTHNKAFLTSQEKYQRAVSLFLREKAGVKTV